MNLKLARKNRINPVAAACPLQADFILKMRLRMASALVELLSMTDKPVDCWTDIVAGLNLCKLIDDTYSSGNADLIAEAISALRNINKRINRCNFPFVLESERETLVQLLNLYTVVVTTVSYNQYIKALDKLKAEL